MTRNNEIVEGDVHIEFPTGWEVIEYDKHNYFNAKLKKLCGQLDGSPEGTKALDGIATDRDRAFLIEIKDFRSYRIPNKHRLSSGELALECALKVRDTLAGIVGAAHTEPEPHPWRCFTRVTARQTGPNPLVVLVLLAQDDPQSKSAKSERSTLTNALKVKTRWLTDHVHVLEPSDLVHLVPGVKVRVERRSQAS